MRRAKLNIQQRDYLSWKGAVEDTVTENQINCMFPGVGIGSRLGCRHKWRVQYTDIINDHDYQKQFSQYRQGYINCDYHPYAKIYYILEYFSCFLYITNFILCVSKQICCLFACDMMSLFVWVYNEYTHSFMSVSLSICLVKLLSISLTCLLSL